MAEDTLSGSLHCALQIFFRDMFSWRSGRDDTGWVAGCYGCFSEVGHFCTGKSRSTRPREKRGHCHPSLPTPGKPGALAVGTPVPVPQVFGVSANHSALAGQQLK
jgi:hypothetical protein